MNDAERHLLNVVATGLDEAIGVLKKNTAHCRLHGVDADTVKEAEHDIATLGRVRQWVSDALFPVVQGRPNLDRDTP